MTFNLHENIIRCNVLLWWWQRLSMCSTDSRRMLYLSNILACMLFYKHAFVYHYRNLTCVQIHHKYRFFEPNGLCMCFKTAPILNRRFAYANRIRLLLFCSASMRLSSVFRVIASKYLLS